MALSDEQMKKICKEEFKQLVDQNLHVSLPVDSKEYDRVSRVANRILRSNRDIQQVSEKDWTVTVIESDEKNAFVLQVLT